MKNVYNHLHAAIKPKIVSRLSTVPRRICRIKNKNQLKRKEISHGKIKMDSHADTEACRSDFTVLNCTYKGCDVAPQNLKDAGKSVPIATYKTAWYDSSGTVCIENIHQEI